EFQRYRLLFELPEGVQLPNRDWLHGKAKCLSLLSDGKQTVMPPSVHANGGRYEWVPGCSPADIGPAPLPLWWRDGGAGPQDHRDDKPRTTGGGGDEGIREGGGGGGGVPEGGGSGAAAPGRDPGRGVVDPAAPAVPDIGQGDAEPDRARGDL